MNQYQKKIVKGTIYSLLSGLIWGICGILGEYFFTHYKVSSGWITSMRLLVAGSLVLILSAFQLRRKLVDIWRDKKNYLPFLAYAILGIFLCSFSFIYALSTQMRQLRLFYNLSVQFLFYFTIEWFTKRRRLLVLSYMF